MSRDEARAILLETFAANPDLPDDIKATLARLIVPPRKRVFPKLA